MVNDIIPTEYRQRLKFISLSTKKPMSEVREDFMFFVKQYRPRDKERFSKSLTEIHQKYVQERNEYEM